MTLWDIVFVPFLGDFFSMRETRMTSHISGKKFSSPFLGTCFQYIIFADDWEIYEEFSSPFSGTFFSKQLDTIMAALAAMVFVPFLGDLFFNYWQRNKGGKEEVFVPFLGDLFFNGNRRAER